MNSVAIGDFIKERRNNLKIQQQDLAELAGLSLRTIIIAESGKGNPSLTTLEKIADVLGLEVKLQVKYRP
ncbi:MAG: helix-turn-helix domain-containing protein [bacterium]|nr:helix-turn-helix domain-containing protein [bacterium]